MFIKSLKIENFKGFHGEHTMNFNTPDGTTEGSGLNIFVGENNAGKSTIFEALDFIKDGSKKELSSLVNRSDSEIVFDGLSIEVTYIGNIKNSVRYYVQENKINSFINHTYEIDGIEHFKVKRSWNKTDPDDVKKINFWNSIDNSYTNPSGIDAPFKKFYDNNFIWADTNPSDESKFGASTICGALLKEIALGHINTPEYKAFQSSYHAIFNNPTSELRTKIAQIETMVQAIFSSQFGNANIAFSFDELQIENFFKTTSVIIDDGVSVPMNEKGHGMQRALALSLLQVYADISSNATESEVSKPFYLFIDEPEICLHPSGQKKLLDALMVISKTKQVFITTHSPFMLSSPSLKNTGLFIFKKDNNKNSIYLSNTTPMFPWSPSWGEISYRAYNLPTVDLHNELYGFLQNQSARYSQNNFERWLNVNGIISSKYWIRESRGVPQNPELVTLQTFIRNHIHHPENTTMLANKYTEDELKQSIEEMIQLL